MTTSTDILAYIPQRPPFVMISEIMHADDKMSKTSFDIKDDNILVKNGAFTEGGLVENMAQTAAAGTGYYAQKEGRPAPVGFIGALKNLRVNELPKVGDKITTESVTIHQIFNAHVVEGKVTCGDKVMATCEFKIYVQQENNT